MRRLSVFNQTSLDGFIADANGDMSWAHKQDPEWDAFTADNAKGGGEMVFGRITYELMASFWPTPQAIQSLPAVAERMNSLPKIVFSRTLDKASWSNTRLVKGDMPAEIRRLKNEPGLDMIIFGSASVVSQLAQEGMIDEYQVVVNPLVLGKGKSMFDGVKRKLDLKLKTTRTFGNGNVVLSYEAMA